jgi:hypothetical protein
MADALPLSLLHELGGPSGPVEQRVACVVAAHPDAAAALEQLGELLVDADCEIVLRLRRGGRQLDAVGLIGPAACVLAAPTEPEADVGWWQVAAAMGAPRLIGAAVGLCPRGVHPHDGMMMPLPTQAVASASGLGGFDELVEELAETMAADGFPADAVRAILSDESLFWTFAAVLPGDEEPAAVVSVVDTASHGLWLVSDGPAESSLLIAATPTFVWRVLCAALAPGEAMAGHSGL